ncbi:MAG: molybdopterin-dependent oxidoreductase [Candidatus Eremiobacteraeota bacterium]|nr:molybdopterin-dependent oxidoreductase [Candidatus Eremiobacteraeota bacterium]
MKRALFLASGAAIALAGCSKASNALNDNQTIRRALSSAESLNHTLIGTHGRAKVYSDADVDREFRVNGFDTPSDSSYARLLADGFSSYRLPVDGLVERPQKLTLAELRTMRSYDEATRHDCVEGWSAIGRWAGVPLASVLALAKPSQSARYVIFHCMDRASDGTPYYESLDLTQAAHPQTVLALDLNGKPLDADHGAPVRLRIPTQLGYKSAKWIGRIEVAADFKHLFAGHGGYWEDQGYEWYAGI